jgi:acyl-CoA synthetase (NDP forming)
MHYNRREITNKIIYKALNEGRNVLLEPEAKTICAAYDVPVPNFCVAKSIDEVMVCLNEIGYPVTLKIVSPDILHKSDVGGVMVDLKDSEAVKQAYIQILNNVKRNCSKARIYGILVERSYAKNAIETAVGVIKDQDFGSILMFGLGGVFIEILRDVTFRAIPVSEIDVQEMIREMKGYPALTGLRGQKPADLKAIMDVITKLSTIVTENPEISQLELNPLFVYQDGAIAVDAKISLHDKEDKSVVKEDVSNKLSVKEIKSLFYPKSICVVGASSKPGKLGYNIMKNLIKLNFPGKIFPINPNEKEVFGIKACSNVLDLLEEVDVAILIIPANKSLSVLDQCGRKGIKFIIIEAAGFAESGEEGKKLQEKIIEIARNYGFRVLGPNCAGLVNACHGLATTFAPLKELKRGNISILAQAGVFAAGMLEVYPWGISKIVTVGNKIDLSEVELLPFLTEDPETKVIGIYIEGTTNGKVFMKTLKMAALKKPIIVLKGGKTQECGKLTLLHTASLAGNMSIWSAILKQCGAIEAETLEEFFDLLKLFSMQPMMKGSNLSIITYSGSMGILAADKAVSKGLKLAEYDERTLGELRKLAFPWTSCFNPLDLSFLIEAEHYKHFLEILIHAPNVHGILCIASALRTFEIGRVIHEVTRYAKKPIIFCIPMGRIDHFKNLEKLGLPCFPTPERAINTIAKSFYYYEWLHKRKSPSLY